MVRYANCNKIVNYIPPSEPTILQNIDYWNARNLKGFPTRKRFLWKRQQGICGYCKDRLGYEPSTLQTHHLLEKGKGGKDKNSNVILVHKGCHETIHNI